MKPRIKFYCRSFDKELYILSSSLYKMAGYPCVRLTDQSADGYFYTILKDTECDIAVNVDEDCFISDLDAVLALADRAWREDWVNIGCSDAGKGIPRSGDPLVTNPFFNVFNLVVLRRRWRDSLIQGLRETSLMTREPYYNFFHWTVTTFPGKTLYLKSDSHPDGLTTVLYDDEGRHICSHSWFARHYHPSILSRIFEKNDVMEVNHTVRIDSLIRDIYSERNLDMPAFPMVSRVSFRLDSAIRWSIKIPQRLCRLPGKIAKKWK